MTRIAYIIQGLSNPAGMERVLTIRVNALADVFDITVITNRQGDKPNYFALDNRIHHIDIQGNDYKRELTEILLQGRFDITVSTGGPELFFAYGIKDGSKKILEFHFSYDVSKVWCADIRNPFRRMLTVHLQTWKRVYYGRFYDRIVVLCKTDAEKWRRWVKNVEYIYNPLTISTSQVSDCTQKNVITVGRLESQKGFDMLVDVWKCVHVRHPDWKLNIFGEGTDRGYLESKIARYELQNSISLPGKTDDMVSKYLNSSIFVLSSRTEGFGLVITEAEACGLPIIAFDCPSAPKELVEDHRNGYLIPLGDIEAMANKICVLIENTQRRQAFGIESAQFAQQFKMENIKKRWIEIYRQCHNTK